MSEKVCPVSLAFLGSCDKRPVGECVLLDNEGVTEGKIAEMEVALSDLETERIELMLSIFSGNSGWECLYAGLIYELCQKELERRRRTT